MDKDYQLNEQKMLKPSNKSGLNHYIKATGYSLKGLQAAWKNEYAFRVEVRLLVVFIPTALLLGQNALERATLLLPLFLIIIAELTNSALEALCDRISLETHPLAGQAKDIGSAIVFVALITTICIWLLFIYERLNPLFTS